MKVYSISKWSFLGICLLIMLLPIGRHWKLLTTGGRTTGTVTEFVMRVVESFGGEKEILFQSEIQFEVDGIIHKTFGPDDYEYRKGRAVTVFYNRNDPSKNCIGTFSGFYLTGYAIVPLCLLPIWYAFYLSFNNYRRREKKQGEKQKFRSFNPRSIRAKNR